MMGKLVCAAATAVWSLMLVSPVWAAGQGERVGQNVGDLLGGWAKNLYVGIAAGRGGAADSGGAGWALGAWLRVGLAATAGASAAALRRPSGAAGGRAGRLGRRAEHLLGPARRTASAGSRARAGAGDVRGPG